MFGPQLYGSRPVLWFTLFAGLVFQPATNKILAQTAAQFPSQISFVDSTGISTRAGSETQGHDPSQKTREGKIVLQSEMKPQENAKPQEIAKPEEDAKPQENVKPQEKIETKEKIEPQGKVELIVLGIAQDAGFPQAGCRKECCQAAWGDPTLQRYVASLGVVDHASGQRWLFDCTPDFPKQLSLFDAKCPPEKFAAGNQPPDLDGIFLSHAHIGHYAGLIHLGREVMGADRVPTYAMPRMSQFLTTNGPWSQLVKLKNISLRPLVQDQPVRLNERITVTPFVVPHRDEFSETVGFKISGPTKTVVFLPDIDKWSRWNRSIETLIQQSDVAYLDGTFFENGEIPGRDMAQIPHPFVSESIAQFSALDESDRKKVRFIHFNHTNPVLQPGSAAKNAIERASMAVAKQGEVVEL